MITYVPINLSNRKFYIGSTVDFERRWEQHLHSSENYPFQNSLRNNPGNFFVLISEDDGLETRDEEQFYLDFYHGAEWCYNLSANTVAPFQGRNHTRESKEKISRPGETNPNYGNSWKWEWSEAQIQALEQRPRGEDHHWSRNNRNMYGENNTFYGRCHTKESNERNRQAHLGENSSVFGTKWWVNEDGENKRQSNSPGPEWQLGRKWRN
jgi:group I intron endonuclease